VAGHPWYFGSRTKQQPKGDGAGDKEDAGGDAGGDADKGSSEGAASEKGGGSAARGAKLKPVPLAFDDFAFRVCKANPPHPPLTLR
jgi:hypothetical protein